MNEWTSLELGGICSVIVSPGLHRRARREELEHRRPAGPVVAGLDGVLQVAGALARGELLRLLQRLRELLLGGLAVLLGRRDRPARLDHLDLRVHARVHGAEVRVGPRLRELERVRLGRAFGEREAGARQRRRVERVSALRRRGREVEVRFGSPLKKNAAPAASFGAADGVGRDRGVISPGGGSPLGTKVTEWNPLMFHLTLSPRWMVTVLAEVLVGVARRPRRTARAPWRRTGPPGPSWSPRPPWPGWRARPLWPLPRLLHVLACFPPSWVWLSRDPNRLRGGAVKVPAG